MPTVADLLGTGPGSIEDVIKIAPSGVALDPNKTQGREHRQLLKDMIAALQASITTPPADPAGAEWVTRPTATINSATVSITAGSATFDGVTVNYTAYSKTLALPASGLIRQDAFAALPNGTYYYIPGTAGTTILTPNIPANALFVTYVLLSAQGGVVQNPNAGQTVTPVTLTDAATITIDGSQSINFNLNNPSLVTALTFANTLPGYDYRIDITGNVAEKVVNLTAISGVSFTDLEDNPITLVTIPIGGCQVSYYHRSSTLRRVEVLAAGNGVSDAYLLKSLTGDTTVNTNGHALDFVHGNSRLNIDSEWVNETPDHKFATVPGSISGESFNPAYTALQYGAIGFKPLYASGTLMPLYPTVELQDGNGGTVTYQFLEDGLYKEGVELAGGGAPQDLTPYKKKATTTELATSGTWALTLDEDKILWAKTLTGNATVTATLTNPGVVQIINFKANGSATVTLPAGAVSEGGQYGEHQRHAEQAVAAVGHQRGRNQCVVL